MEAKRRPRDVGQKVNIKYLVAKEMWVSHTQTNDFEGADVDLKASTHQKSFQHLKETGRRRVRQARRDKKDSKKEKKRSRSKRYSPGRGDGHRRNCGRAAGQLRS